MKNPTMAVALKAAGRDTASDRLYVVAQECLAKRDNEIVERCTVERCNFVLMSKCNGMGASVVTGCQRVGAKVLFWYMDPLWNFTPEIENRVRTCDMTFCALREPYEKAKAIAPDKTHFLQEGYDEDVDKPWETPFEHDVSFIGNVVHSEKRKEYAEKAGFVVITGMYGEDHAKAVCRSRINLNFTHGGTSDRTYKVLAAGGFLLTESWSRMEDDFTPGKDFVTFDGVDELESKIKYWLARPEERMKIQMHGMKTVQKFSRDMWAWRILEEARK